MKNIAKYIKKRTIAFTAICLLLSFISSATVSIIEDIYSIKKTEILKKTIGSKNITVEINDDTPETSNLFTDQKHLLSKAIFLSVSNLHYSKTSDLYDCLLETTSPPPKNFS